MPEMNVSGVGQTPIAAPADGSTQYSPVVDAFGARAIVLEAVSGNTHGVASVTIVGSNSPVDPASMQDASNEIIIVVDHISGQRIDSAKGSAIFVPIGQNSAATPELFAVPCLWRYIAFKVVCTAPAPTNLSLVATAIF